MASGEKNDGSSKGFDGAVPKRGGEGSPARRAVAALRSPVDNAPADPSEKTPPAGDVRLEKDVMSENIRLMLSEAPDCLLVVARKMPEKAEQLGESLAVFKQTFQDTLKDSSRPSVASDLSELVDQVADWAETELNPAVKEAQNMEAAPAPETEVADEEDGKGGDKGRKKAKNRRAQGRRKKDGYPAPAPEPEPVATAPEPTPAEPPSAPESTPASELPPPASAPDAHHAPDKSTTSDDKREQALSAVPEATTVEDFETFINVLANFAHKNSPKLSGEMSSLISFVTKLRKKFVADASEKAISVIKFNRVFKKILGKHPELDLGELKISLEVALAKERSVVRDKKPTSQKVEKIKISEPLTMEVAQAAVEEATRRFPELKLQAVWDWKKKNHEKLQFGAFWRVALAYLNRDKSLGVEEVLAESRVAEQIREEAERELKEQKARSKDVAKAVEPAPAAPAPAAEPPPAPASEPALVPKPPAPIGDVIPPGIFGPEPAPVFPRTETRPPAPRVERAAEINEAEILERRWREVGRSLSDFRDRFFVKDEVGKEVKSEFGARIYKLDRLFYTIPIDGSGKLTDLKTAKRILAVIAGHLPPLTAEANDLMAAIDKRQKAARAKKGFGAKIRGALNGF